MNMSLSHLRKLAATKSMGESSDTPATETKKSSMATNWVEKDPSGAKQYSCEIAPSPNEKTIRLIRTKNGKKEKLLIRLSDTDIQTLRDHLLE